MKINFDLPIRTWIECCKIKLTCMEEMGLRTLLSVHTRCPGIDNCANCGDCGNCFRHPDHEDNYKPKINGKEVLS
jgi:hypothetical protein